MSDRGSIKHDPYSAERLATLRALLGPLAEAQRILKSSASTLDLVARQVSGDGPPPPPWREVARQLQQELQGCAAATAQGERDLPALGAGAT